MSKKSFIVPYNKKYLKILLSSKKYSELVVLIDKEDYKFIKQYRWFPLPGRKTFYTVANILKKQIRMHRLIMGLSFGDGQQIDHINGNGLDNRKCNLRICSSQENRFNQPSRRNTKSQYKGVTWNTSHKKWTANIRRDNIFKFLGYFYNEIEAAQRYDETALKLFGEFAYLNFPIEKKYANKT